MRVAAAEVGGSSEKADLLEAIATAAAGAAKARADLLVLPQLATVPYFPCAKNRTRAYYNLSERGEGDSLAAFRAAAGNGLWVWGSYYETLAEGVFYCRAVLIRPDQEMVGTYRQVHIDDRIGSWERFYLQPGRRGFETTGTSLGQIGMLLGADAQIPEAWRVLSLAGSELVLVGLSEQDEGLETVFRHVSVAAETNQVYVVACNRRGKEFDSTFPGGSKAFASTGEEIEGEAVESQIVLFEIDLESRRRGTQEHVRTRRPEFYASLAET